MIDRKPEAVFIRLKASKVSDVAFKQVKNLLDEIVKKNPIVDYINIPENYSDHFVEESFDPDETSSYEKLKNILLDKNYRRSQICIVMNASDLMGYPETVLDLFNHYFKRQSDVFNPRFDREPKCHTLPAFSKFAKMQALLRSTDGFSENCLKLFILGQKTFTPQENNFLHSEFSKIRTCPLHILSLDNMPEPTEDDTKLVRRFFANFLCEHRSHKSEDRSFPAMEEKMKIIKIEIMKNSMKIKT